MTNEDDCFGNADEAIETAVDVSDQELSGPITLNEVLQCQFSSWYNTFRPVPKDCNISRSSVTVKSIVLSLPPTFVDYLSSDGIRLPEGATKVSSCVPAEKSQKGNEDVDEDVWSSEDEAEHLNEEESPPQDSQQFSFPELNDDIASAIESLGGAVMPKLNWSAPKDAGWINNGTLKCKTPGDVYLLLKSSDFILHDVQHAFDDIVREDDNDDNGNKKISCETKAISYELALRKWCNLHPSMEFRCFVCHHEFVAISQRQHTQQFPHLVTEGQMFRSFIIDFFDTVIKGRFAGGNIAQYSFDVYVDKKDRVWLLDFNVWGVRTDALLFEWQELKELARKAQKEASMSDHDRTDGSENEDAVIQSVFPEFRVVETENEIRQDPLSSYRAPIDTVDLASVVGGAGAGFEDFMAMCERPSTINKLD